MIDALANIIIRQFHDLSGNGKHSFTIARMYMLSNYCDLAPSGVPIIIENMDRFFARTLPPALPQDPAKTGYWTFPTPEELDQYQKDGLVLVDGSEMAQIYMNMFSGNNEAVNQELQGRIIKAIDQWEKHKMRDSKPQSKPQQFTL